MGVMRLSADVVGGRAEIPAWTCMCFGRAERTCCRDEDDGVAVCAGSEVDRVGCLRIETGPAGRDAEGPRGVMGRSEDGVGAEDTRGGAGGLEGTRGRSGVETRLPLVGWGSSWAVGWGKEPLRGDFRDGLVEVDEASELDVEMRFREELGVGVEVEDRTGPLSWVSGSSSTLSSYAWSFDPRSVCRRFVLSRFESLFNVFSVVTISVSWEGLE